jgi:protein-tyrosine phosphatase
MAELFTISRAGVGQLSTMAAPAGQEQLLVALAALKRRGVDVVVSMLASREESRLGLSREEQQCLLVGLEFVRLPTGDFRSPDIDATRRLASNLAARLADGQHVVIHCRGGVGRSSTLAAAVLLTEGLSPDRAWAAISAARGASVPESESQRELVKLLAEGGSNAPG